jgi:hypothetical protein
MKRPEPIIDYYGTAITVEGEIGCSVGFMVDLERDVSEGPAGAAGRSNTFDRLTPDQAEDLGKRLIEAAEETRR